MKRIEGCQELTENDVKLFKLLQSKGSYYAVIDNDIITVVDRELENQDVDAVAGDFSSYGQEFIMAMFEFMKIDAEYC